jgi:hypothetical protein
MEMSKFFQGVADATIHKDGTDPSFIVSNLQSPSVNATDDFSALFLPALEENTAEPSQLHQVTVHTLQQSTQVPDGVHKAPKMTSSYIFACDSEVAMKKTMTLIRWLTSK